MSLRYNNNRKQNIGKVQFNKVHSYLDYSAEGPMNIIVFNLSSFLLKSSIVAPEEQLSKFFDVEPLHRSTGSNANKL